MQKYKNWTCPLTIFLFYRNIKYIKSISWFPQYELIVNAARCTLFERGLYRAQFAFESVQYFEEIWCSNGKLANAISDFGDARRKLSAGNEASWIPREFSKAWPRRINARNFDFNVNAVSATWV